MPRYTPPTNKTVTISSALALCGGIVGVIGQPWGAMILFALAFGYLLLGNMNRGM